MMMMLMIVTAQDNKIKVGLTYKRTRRKRTVQSQAQVNPPISFFFFSPFLPITLVLLFFLATLTTYLYYAMLIFSHDFAVITCPLGPRATQDKRPAIGGSNAN